LVDILIKLTEKNMEKLPFLDVPPTVSLNQSQYMPHAPLLAATSETVPQIAQEAARAATGSV
jgi:hypothetical protein